jgi:hypothetical protein
MKERLHYLQPRRGMELNLPLVIKMPLLDFILLVEILILRKLPDKILTLLGSDFMFGRKNNTGQAKQWFSGG